MAIEVSQVRNSDHGTLKLGFVKADLVVSAETMASDIET